MKDTFPKNETMMERYWINQPSNLQLLHKYHGRLVLAPRIIKSKNVTIYFIDGEVISALLPANILSQGWPKHLIKNEN